MQTQSSIQRSIQESAGRAFGISIGNLFIGVFGMCWILLGLGLVGAMNSTTITLSAARMNPLLITLLSCYLAILVFSSLYIMRRTCGSLDRSDANRAMRTKINGQFGLINLVQWGAIFAAFYALPRLGLGDWILPAIILIVGIHFFPLARLFNAPRHYVTGAVMAAWAILYPALFSAGKGGSIGAVGAGAILWTTTAFTGWQALRLLRQMPTSGTVEKIVVPVRQ